MMISKILWKHIDEELSKKLLKNINLKFSNKKKQ